MKLQHTSACFFLFTSIYWGVLMSLAEHADDVLKDAFLYEAIAAED